MPMFRGGWSYANPPNVNFELNTDSPQARGLIRWYPFIGGKGNYIREYIRDKNFNSITGASQIFDSKLGKGLRFANTNDHEVRITAITLTAPFSIAIWARPTGSSNFRGLIGETNNGTNSCYLNLNSGSFQFRAAQFAQNVVSASPTPSTGLNFYVVTLDAAGNGKGYINGINQGNQTGVTQSGFYINQIGQFWNNNSYTFDGDVFDVRFYDRVLSQAETIDGYINVWDLYRPIVPKLYSIPPTGDLSVSNIKIKEPAGLPTPLGIYDI